MALIDAHGKVLGKTAFFTALREKFASSILR
jgi:hypothetical protein